MAATAAEVAAAEADEAAIGSTGEPLVPPWGPLIAGGVTLTAFSEPASRAPAQAFLSQ